jgi:hypothetical protein
VVAAKVAVPQAEAGRVVAVQVVAAASPLI